ncbi:MAG: glycoside hydrolase family 16 protein [Verrucomicrobiales bacterium]|nr:glycoside hydrolase family 16 protein [Verrucomicrobiales bacterium]
MNGVFPRFPVLILVVATVAILAWGQQKQPVEVDPEVWKLTFVDEFDGGKLDREKWNPYDPWEVVRNGELQGYVPNSIFFKDGVLRIRASKQQSLYDGETRAYSSGIITTKSKFSQKYGRFEICCKVPKGKGLWPAFWMLPEPLAWPPEIDVMELLGHETNVAYLTHHWPHPRLKDESESITKDFKGPDFSAGFHTFAVEWEPDEIRWFVDGVQRHRAKKQIPDVPMFLLVNLAVGGGWPGNPNEKTEFPAYFEVDYVKAWKKIR